MVGSEGGEGNGPPRTGNGYLGGEDPFPDPE